MARTPILYSTPLSEIVQARKSYYETKMHKALDALKERLSRELYSAYSQGDLKKIGQLEQTILGLNQPQSAIQPTRKETKRSHIKPLLDYSTYRLQRKKGKSEQELLQRYRLKSPDQLLGYKSAYSKGYKGKK